MSNKIKKSKIIGYVNILSTIIVYALLLTLPYGKVCNLDTSSLFNIFIESISKRQNYLNLLSFLAIEILIMIIFKLSTKFDTFGKAFGSVKNTKKFYSIYFSASYVFVSILSTIVILITSQVYSSYFKIDNAWFSLLIILECFISIILTVIERIFVNTELATRETEEKEVEGNILQAFSKKEGKRKTFISICATVLSIVVSAIFIFGYVFPLNRERSFYIHFNNAPYANVYNVEFGNNNLSKLNFHNTDNLVFNNKTGTHYLEYYSSNYLYYQSLIEETDKKIKSLFPESNSPDALNNYAKELATLNDNLNLLKQKIYQLNYAKITIKYTVSTKTTTTQWGSTTKYNYSIDEITYDTDVNSNNSTKWENKSSKYFLSGKKITLEKNEFSSDTDFNTQKVGIKIYYGDGSMKFYYTTPENAQELNDTIGKATFKWSDSWGNYESTIIINE